MRARIRFLLGCCTMLVGNLYAQAPAGAQSIDSLVRISGNTPFANCTADQSGSQPGTNYPESAIEPWIAVDPTRAGHLLTGVQQDRWSDGGARGLRGAVSVNGGKNWTTTIPRGATLCTGGPYQRSTDVWTAFGLDGTAYFFSLAFNNNPTPDIEGASAMLVSRSGNGGASWERPVALIADTDPLAFNDKNSMTADPLIAGNAYAVWDRLYGPASAFIAPGGSDEKNSGVAQAVTHDRMDMVRGRIKAARTAAASSTTAAAALAPATYGPSFFSRTTDSGRTWTYAVPIYDPGRNAQTIGNVIVATPSGELLDFFTLFTAQGGLSFDLIRSRDHGLSWSRRPELVAPTTGTGANTPDSGSAVRQADIIFSVSVDPNSGNLYFVWEDTVPAFGNITRIFFSQSTDSGKTWSAPTRINKTPANANPQRSAAFNGTVVAGGDNTLVATYYDFRNDVSTRGVELADVWVIFCRPSAARGDCTKPSNWVRERRLTNLSFDITQAPLTGSGYFLGDYFGLIAQGTNVWPAFTVTTGPGKTALYTRPIHLGVAN